jgi:hypothetical protein
MSYDDTKFEVLRVSGQTIVLRGGESQEEVYVTYMENHTLIFCGIRTLFAVQDHKSTSSGLLGTVAFEGHRLEDKILAGRYTVYSGKQAKADLESDLEGYDPDSIEYEGLAHLIRTGLFGDDDRDYVVDEASKIDPDLDECEIGEVISPERLWAQRIAKYLLESDKGRRTLGLDPLKKASH